MVEESAGERKKFVEQIYVMHKRIDTFSLVQSTQLSGKLSRLENKHVRKIVHASRYVNHEDRNLSTRHSESSVENCGTES